MALSAPTIPSKVLTPPRPALVYGVWVQRQDTCWPSILPIAGPLEFGPLQLPDSVSPDCSKLHCGLASASRPPALISPTKLQAPLTSTCCPAAQAATPTERTGAPVTAKPTALRARAGV